MTIYLLDANTCIGWLRQNQPQIVARIQAQAQTNIVCSVVVAELLFGVERSDPVHRANNGVRVDQLRAQFTSLPFDDAAADTVRSNSCRPDRAGTAHRRE